MLRNTERSWGSVAKFLHWFMAAVVFAQFALGWMAVTWRLSPTKLELFIWHKSFGILLLALVLLRAAWRLVNSAPALPPGTAGAEALAARSVHLLLYGVLIAMPLSGWVVNSAANIPFRVFWWFPLPAISAPDKTLAELAKQVHFALFLALAVFITLHIVAALRHHFLKRNDILTRMLPARRSKP